MMAPARLFGIAPGQDFGTTFVTGLEARYCHLAPHEFARIQIYVNTRRMQRRLRDIFDVGRPALLPRIRLITELADNPLDQSAPNAVPALQYQLELSRLIGKFLEADPDQMAPAEARFDLAESLSALLSEIYGEGVDPAALHRLDVTDQSGHWERTLAFINIVQHYFESTPDKLNTEARQRLLAEAFSSRVTESPPQDPLIIAGSTGSRGTTAILMEAVSRIPNGSVVLPGVDPHMPPHVWDSLSTETGGEDHPQFRFKKLCDSVGIHPTEIAPWQSEVEENTARAKLISLSLRPAPVTDEWISDGPKLDDLHGATNKLTLLEAPSPRAEAEAIAIKLRQAIEDRKSVALISPDRQLTRRVSATLDRWGFIADDSAGIPLQLTPEGRLLRQAARLFSETLTGKDLLALLKHPLCHQGSDRGPHNLRTIALELHIRRFGPAFPTAEDLLLWAEKSEQKDPGRIHWARWIGQSLPTPHPMRTRPVNTWIHDHLEVAQSLNKGHNDDTPSALWQREGGQALQKIFEDMRLHGDAAGDITAREYVILLDRLIAAEELRKPDEATPNVYIWGQMEARVETVDVVILGGMNERVWPAAPAPDPWLNRRLRAEAGLLLPERRIGLAAHDYQIAMNAPEVVVSRAVRSDEAETVPSRWVNRLTNLLSGLPQNNGPEALKGMKVRGRELLAVAQLIETPDDRSPLTPRPSPAPPASARPSRLSVTEIKTLIRDPYAIYGRHILGLISLDPLAQSPNAALRGNIVHSVLERFVKEGIDPGQPTAKDTLLSIAEEILEQDCPWPADRRLWIARIERFAESFLQTEIARQEIATPTLLETKAEIVLKGLDFTLVGKADRIDIGADGACVYDYKTGIPPTKAAQKYFDKQLLLEAAMIEEGAFHELGPRAVAVAEFIGLTQKLSIVSAPLEELPPKLFWAQFHDFIRAWSDDTRGYTSRRSNMSVTQTGAYDHLARYGEWDESAKPVRQVLK